MYDGLYARIPEFERRSGLAVEVVDRLPHPELNARVDRDRASAGSADLDLVSTHTKYAPSQAPWLAPLDGLVDARQPRRPPAATARAGPDLGAAPAVPPQPRLRPSLLSP